MIIYKIIWLNIVLFLDMSEILLKRTLTSRCLIFIVILVIIHFTG